MSLELLGSKVKGAHRWGAEGGTRESTDGGGSGLTYCRAEQSYQQARAVELMVWQGSATVTCAQANTHRKRGWEGYMEEAKEGFELVLVGVCQW